MCLRLLQSLPNNSSSISLLSTNISHQFDIKNFPYKFMGVKAQESGKSSIKTFRKRHVQPDFQKIVLKFMKQYKNSFISFELPTCQPNFKKKIIKAMASLKSSRITASFQETKAETCKIIDVNYFVGLSKFRHLNFDLDKYSQRTKLDEQAGYHGYVLDRFKFRNHLVIDKLAQAHRTAVLRVTVQVTNGGSLTLTSPTKQTIAKDQNQTHIVTLETQMGPAPQFAQFKRNLSQYCSLLKTKEQWWLADIDGTNEYLQLVYPRKSIKSSEFTSMIK